jgi:hypothetical protein
MNVVSINPVLRQDHLVIRFLLPENSLVVLPAGTFSIEAPAFSIIPLKADPAHGCIIFLTLSVSSTEQIVSFLYPGILSLHAESADK